MAEALLEFKKLGESDNGLRHTVFSRNYLGTYYTMQPNVKELLTFLSHTTLVVDVKLFRIMLR